jgi:hypothetical protein
MALAVGVTHLKMNRFLTRAHDGSTNRTNPLSPSTEKQSDLNSTLTTVLRVQVWDGTEPLVPIIHMKLVPRSMPLFRPARAEDRTASDAKHATRPLGASSAAIGSRFDAIEFASDQVSDLPHERHAPLASVEAGAPTSSKDFSAMGRLDTLVSEDNRTTVIDHIVNHPDFVALYTCAQLKRTPYVVPLRTALKLRATPEKLRLFLLGKWIDPRRHKDVSSLMRLTGSKFNVGWSEVTLDLALNPEADAHLRTRCYSTSYTFSLLIDSVELSMTAIDEAPFSEMPSIYVMLEHGTTRRYSHIEHGKLSPVFDWESGAIPFDPDDSLKVRVLLASSYKPRPNRDRVIGQTWLKPPVVPFAIGLVSGAVRAMSLGENVGVIHLSLCGPALRRSHVEGCVACWCPSCCCIPFVPCCTVPACCPSMGAAFKFVVRDCYSCVTSTEFKVCSAVLCCCCAGVSKLAYDVVLPRMMP